MPPLTRPLTPPSFDHLCKGGCHQCRNKEPRSPKFITNELKTWPEHFEAIKRGDKRFEARRNDRDFQLGDGILLREFDPNSGYTGRQEFAEITYLLTGEEFGIMPGFVLLGIRLHTV